MKKTTSILKRTKDNNSYQHRIVSYETVHAINEHDFDVLVSIVNPQNGQTILDVCCGYGAVAERLGKVITENNLNTKMVLLDSSDQQIQRAKDYLNNQNREFILSDARDTPFPDNYFDTIVNKMGLHEVDKESQKDMLKELYRILKPGGKIIIWELALTEKTQPIFRRIIKKKDELAGFDSMATNRYFPTKNEVLFLLRSTSFINDLIEHEIIYNLSIRNRKEELVSKERFEILRRKSIIGPADEEKLEKISERKISELREYIRENLNEEEKLLMDYSEKENDTFLSTTKAIYSAMKPS